MLNRVPLNGKKGKHAHVFIDEFHVVFVNEFAAQFVNSDDSFRVNSCCCTTICYV